VNDVLAGKRLLITGVLTGSSIAYAAAREARAQGATVVLSGFGRSKSITERIARRLAADDGGAPVPVVELDLTSDADYDALPERLREHVDSVDGALHAAGFAPEAILNDAISGASWQDAALALQVSTWSLPALCRALRPVLARPASIVGLTFDATVSWPNYGWMGIAKAGLEASCRGLARELGPDGVRVNLVAAGPLKTTAASHIPGFSAFDEVWSQRAPLGWQIGDTTAAGLACVALFSDLFPATTGEIVHVDGGVHATGA
jgi:enoyl-[acyl-carrier protein] reductase I